MDAIEWPTHPRRRERSFLWVSTMSQTSQFRIFILRCAGCGLVVLAAFAALSGVLGSALQDLALGWALLFSVFAATLAVGLVLLGDWSSVIASFDSERKLVETDADLATSSESDADAERLRTALEANLQQENECLARYAQRNCAMEDVLRARALRVQAEIALIRHQDRPKTWAEVCREHRSGEVGGP